MVFKQILFTLTSCLTGSLLIVCISTLTLGQELMEGWWNVTRESILYHWCLKQNLASNISSINICRLSYGCLSCHTLFSINPIAFVCKVPASASPLYLMIPRFLNIWQQILASELTKFFQQLITHSLIYFHQVPNLRSQFQQIFSINCMNTPHNMHICKSENCTITDIYNNTLQ